MWTRRNHDLNLATRCADDVALLAQGCLLRHGSPDYTLDPETLSSKLQRTQAGEDGGSWLLTPY